MHGMALDVFNEPRRTMIGCSLPTLVRSHRCSVSQAAVAGLLAVRKPQPSLSPLCTHRHYLVRLQALTKHDQPSSTPSDPAAAASLAKVLKALELLSLATSVGLQGYALVMTSRQDDHRAERYETEPYHAEAVSPPTQYTGPNPTLLSHFAIVALILTYFLGLLHRMCSSGR